METKHKTIDKVHIEQLGLGMPEGYFETSKKEILSKTSEKKKVKVISLYKNKMIWFVAAGIALVFSLTVYNNQTMNTIKDIPEMVLDTLNFDENLNLAMDYMYEEDVLISSLFMDDENVGDFVNNAFIQDITADAYLDDFIVDELMTDDLF